MFGTTDGKTSYLTGQRVYLSGPIEHGQPGDNWRTAPKKVLAERFGLDVFDPFDDPKQQWVPALTKAQAEKDFETMVRIARQFVKKDLKMVDRADIVVSYLPRKVPTTGTHHEIINSSNQKKPTLLVCPQGKEFDPLWYYGFIPTEFMFGSWDDLYTYLDEVNQGKYKDNDRWAFTYGLI
jgi:nucleoside 2-deoxyribosyltransferase